jgi:hypothetical protein
MAATNTSGQSNVKGVNIDMNAEEIWVHGSIAEVEFPQFPHGGAIIRTGAGIRVQSNGDDRGGPIAEVSFSAAGATFSKMPIVKMPGPIISLAQC